MKGRLEHALIRSVSGHTLFWLSLSRERVRAVLVSGVASSLWLFKDPAARAAVDRLIKQHCHCS